jgi:glycosyltransferase A (GT-A) superfamily protein (DUF2064 family)
MSGVAWGSSQVLADTLSRAAQLELTCTLLRLQNDLDRRGDLEPWLRPRAEHSSR